VEIMTKQQLEESKTEEQNSADDTNESSEHVLSPNDIKEKTQEIAGLENSVHSL